MRTCDICGGPNGIGRDVELPDSAAAWLTAVCERCRARFKPRWARKARAKQAAHDGADNDNHGS